MIVIDASAAAEIVLQSPAARGVREVAFADGGRSACAPHVIDLEIAQVLRRYVVNRQFDAGRGQEALDDLAALPIFRYPHRPFLRRIWELRRNFSAYDAAYVALAEVLGATLLTRDRKLAAAAKRVVRVEVV